MMFCHHSTDPPQQLYFATPGWPVCYATENQQAHCETVFDRTPRYFCKHSVLAKPLSPYIYEVILRRLCTEVHKMGLSQSTHSFHCHPYWQSFHRDGWLALQMFLQDPALFALHTSNSCVIDDRDPKSRMNHEDTSDDLQSEQFCDKGLRPTWGLQFSKFFRELFDLLLSTASKIFTSIA